MILLLQAVARLVTLLLLVILALVGVAVAVFSLLGGEGGLPSLAELIALPTVREEVGAFLDSLESDGAGAPAALAGFGAAIAAVLLILGALLPRGERVAALPSSPTDDGDDEAAPPGRLAARRRPLGQMAAALAERVREPESLTLRVRPRRRGVGGKLRIRARLARGGNTAAVSERLRSEVQPVAEPFALRPDVRVKPARREQA